jgi:nucleotide-binding universal stress UspA family protein
MIQLKRILLPTDFSETAVDAKRHGIALARAFGAELHLLHVFPLRAESLLMPTPRPGDEMERAVGAHLEELATLIREAGVRCEISIRRGDPAFQILQAAREEEADLIVMATHGRKGVPRVVLGSVTEAVLHATPAPLLTIPPRAPGRGGSFRRVLCAVDFSPSSPATFAHALAMVTDSSGSLIVLNVIDPAFSSSAPDAARASAERALASLHGRVPAEGGWCAVRDAVRFGDTATEVLKAAEEEEAHLIVVGAHSRRPAVAAMVGSCADRIVRESPCAVLAVPAPSPVVPIPLFHPVYA